jgi:hypothetical protein
MTVGVSRTMRQYRLSNGIAGIPSPRGGNEHPAHHTRLPRYCGSSESEDTEAIHLAYNTYDIGTRSLPLAQCRVWYAYHTFVQEQPITS